MLERLKESCGGRGDNLLIQIGFASSSFNTSFLGLSKLLDVTVHGVLESQVNLRKLSNIGPGQASSDGLTKMIAILGAMIERVDSANWCWRKAVTANWDCVGGCEKRSG